MGGLVLVICAGTIDVPVAEEAAVTAELGNEVEQLCDAGVAGLHRLLAQRNLLAQARASGLRLHFPALVYCSIS